ncbi:hypothetical protein Glove_137g87 [Diversispora epigaea]|uniref:Uncharacterized protein n=1 Tax=Diversispora epigaea TaxID=1348612 RepID=A0A397IW75_9GLOM|nr:hypothetical protein Glove_137g87 [Diversispora epigaea]
MKPTLMPKITEMCEEFVASFVNHNYQNIISEKLIHNGSWKESEENLSDTVKEIFALLKDIWINPIFNSDLVKSLNEGTYQLTVIFLSIRVILKNLPFRLSSFISTSELYVLPKSQIIWDLGCQNAQITSIWDLGFGILAKNTNYNLGFGIWDFGIWDFGVWISNLDGRYNQNDKKKDDEIKLWRKCNNGMYYVRKALKPEKEQFGIIGVQVAAKIPVQISDANIVTNFIETLLLLRNILITNISLLCYGSISTSQRLTEGIDKLRKENAEIPELRREKDSLGQNSLIEIPLTLSRSKNGINSRIVRRKLDCLKIMFGIIRLV